MGEPKDSNYWAALPELRLFHDICLGLFKKSVPLKKKDMFISESAFPQLK